MGGNKFEQLVDQATNESLTEENWQQYMHTSDELRSASESECLSALKAIRKRLGHKNARVVLFTISLLNACFENSGDKFRRVVCSRDFFKDVTKLYKSKNPDNVKSKMTSVLTSWEKDYGSRTEFMFIKTMISELRSDGLLLSTSATTTASNGYSSSLSTGTTFSAAPSLTSSSFLRPTGPPAQAQQQQQQDDKQFEDDIAKAIAASLQDPTPQRQQQPAQAPSSSLYSGLLTGISNSSTHGPTAAPQQRKKPAQRAKVLYDFEGVEENELTLQAGEFVSVTDKSDPGWWKGHKTSGPEGYFPSGFVTFDLQAIVVPETPAQKAAEQRDASDDEAADSSDDGDGEGEDEDEAPTADRSGDASGPGSSVNVQAATIRPELFDEFLNLVTTTPHGNHANDARISQVEKECDESMPQLNEMVDQYDRRLAEVNNLFEKYSLISTLAQRLMQQPPALSRLHRPAHELGMAMPPATPPHAQQQQQQQYQQQPPHFYQQQPQQLPHQQQPTGMNPAYPSGFMQQPPPPQQSQPSQLPQHMFSSPQQQQQQQHQQPSGPYGNQPNPQAYQQMQPPQMQQQQYNQQSMYSQPQHLQQQPAQPTQYQQQPPPQQQPQYHSYA